MGECERKGEVWEKGGSNPCPGHVLCGRGWNLHMANLQVQTHHGHVTCAGVARSLEDIAGSGGLTAAATSVVLAQRLTRNGPILVSLGKSNIVDHTKYRTKEIFNTPGQPMEFRDRIVFSPVRDTAVQRAIQEIQRILFSLDDRGKEMPWADIVRFRNPSVNERAMVRARTRMQEEGLLFKRPVYGNTCVYSLTDFQVPDIPPEWYRVGTAGEQSNRGKCAPCKVRCWPCFGYPRYSLQIVGPRYSWIWTWVMQSACLMWVSLSGNTLFVASPNYNNNNNNNSTTAAYDPCVFLGTGTPRTQSADPGGFPGRCGLHHSGSARAHLPDPAGFP